MFPDVFNIASCMAENADATCRALTAYLGRRLKLATRFVDGVSWREREAMLDRGEIHLCWICGLPYVWKAAAQQSAIELSVVPVMKHDRYRRTPVYFSDVIVHSESRFKTFGDLRGVSWAYNERRSHSGYNVVRHHLAKLGQKSGYFGRTVESGAHQASLRLVSEGKIDASAIDSTVLEEELRRYPQYRSQIRVIATLGPSPMPPWVITRSVPAKCREEIANVMLDMHRDEEGHAILQQWGIAHFATARPHDYEPIVSMARLARDVRLSAQEML